MSKPNTPFARRCVKRAMRTMLWMLLYLSAWLTAGRAVPAAAEDVVWIRGLDDAAERVRLVGTIVEYTGSRVVVETSGGARINRPGSQVLGIETVWTAEHQAGDALYAKGQVREAVAQYQAALRTEKRRWAQHKIAERLIRGYVDLEQWGPAGELFLSLVRSDPDTPYFAAIPLRWLPGEPTPDLEQTSQTWLAQRDDPIAVLLGASHLMSTSARPRAVERLAPLARDGDVRIASLAEGQLWRAAAVTASTEQLEAWARVVEACPEPLRAGLHSTLGRALAQQGEHRRAAIELMKVPILYPDEHALVRSALLGAGRSLERIGQVDEAGRVYGELLNNFPTSREAFEARERQASLAPGGGAGRPP